MKSLIHIFLNRIIFFLYWKETLTSEINPDQKATACWHKNRMQQQKLKQFLQIFTYEDDSKEQYKRNK